MSIARSHSSKKRVASAYHPTASSLLGGAEIFGVDDVRENEWIKHVRNGLPGKVVANYRTYTGFPIRLISTSIGIAERTLARREKEHLSPAESEKVVRLARVTARAEEVFQDKDKALRWLQTPNPALGHSPIEMMDTEIGGGAVLETLGRIEHGVYD